MRIKWTADRIALLRKLAPRFKNDPVEVAREMRIPAKNAEMAIYRFVRAPVARAPVDQQGQERRI